MDTIQTIKNEKPDSVEIKQSAKGELYYTIKIYFDADGKIEDMVNKVNGVKKAVEEKIIGEKK